MSATGTPDLLVTKEGVRVQIGQVWRDLDKRMENGRMCRVVALDAEKGHAYVVDHRQQNPARGRTRLSVRRMHRSSTGWALHSPQEADGKDAP